MIAADPLPLAKGAKWTYEVTVKRFDPDTNKETTKTLVVDDRGRRRPRGQRRHRVSRQGLARPISRLRSARPDGDRAHPAALRQQLHVRHLARAHARRRRGLVHVARDRRPEDLPERRDGLLLAGRGVETGYALSFYTGPDEQTFELEPGTGVSRFHYAHHGTTNEVDAKLKSYTKGKR